MKKLALGIGVLGLASFLPLFLLIGFMFALVGDDDAGPAVPTEYAGVVARAGAVCAEISPALIAAQIEAESRWNDVAVSPAGAMGISQFMPATWEEWGRDGDGDGKADIFNPQDAIFSQGFYMCELASSVRKLVEAGEASGDITDLALAAYNAGLGSVQSYGGIPPFSETQNYFSKIKELASSKYASQIPAGPVASTVMSWLQGQLGKPYRGHGFGPGCGSFGPDCWDCCGLAYGAYKAAGIELPMSTPGNPWATAKCEYAVYSRYSEYGGVRFEIAPGYANLQPGDLVFFQSILVDPAYDNITHVAIYAGDGFIIDAIPSAGVSRRPLTSGSDRLLPHAVRVGG